LIIEGLGYIQWSIPLKILGVNALFIFIFHVLLLKLQFYVSISLPNGTTGNLKTVLTEYLFGGFSPQNAILFYSLTFLFLNFIVAAILYKRKIFIKL